MIGEGKFAGGDKISLTWLLSYRRYLATEKGFTELLRNTIFKRQENECHCYKRELCIIQDLKLKFGQKKCVHV